MRLEKQRRRSGGAYVDRVEDPSKQTRNRSRSPTVLTVQELATSMIVPAADVIRELIRIGTMATINQNISSDQATAVARKFGFNAIVKEAGDEVVVERKKTSRRCCRRGRRSSPSSPRRPRQDVTARQDPLCERRGRRSRRDHAKDRRLHGRAKRPRDHLHRHAGHEAFTAMRARRRQSHRRRDPGRGGRRRRHCRRRRNDSHIKAAGVPIVVAINKIDQGKTPNPIASSSSTDEGLQPVEWGGKVEMVGVSARNGTNIDQLLETVLLEARSARAQSEPAPARQRRGDRVRTRPRPRSRRDRPGAERHAAGWATSSWSGRPTARSGR